MAQPIFCDVCNIGVSSEVSMRSHVKGRRHQQAERRRAMDRNSLYCHGFDPSTPTPTLHTYFQHFGPVNHIMVERQKGCYCIVHYDSEAPVQKALNHRNHHFFGCMLTVRPRKHITPSRRLVSETERNQQKAKAAKDEEEVENSHEQLMSSLLQADTVLSQMEILYETMRLSDGDLDRRQTVCDYLYSVLCPFLPTCSIHQFGSSVNGFGLRGCDMDIFLDLHDNDVSLQREETLRHKLKPVSLPYIREIQALKTTEGPLLPSQLRQLSLVHRVKLLSRILMKHAPHCMDVLFVPSVRCPIVRFIHSPTGIKCDLSINNRLALRNTQLLKMCAEDRRVRLLVFAVRYWGKWKQVAGNQNCGPRLSNYCLSLLVLFYLANTSPPLLPSVQTLADMSDLAQKCMIEDWDCSLPEAVPSSENSQPADELLQGFFKFYHELSLSTSVLLTRSGAVVPLNEFLTDNTNTPYLNDFKVKALAVQDPFVLQHNIAQNINLPLRDLLLREIDYAAAKTGKWSPPLKEDGLALTAQTSNPTNPTPYSLWGLPYLFSSQDCTPSTPQSSSSASPSSPWCESVSDNAGTSNKSSRWTLSLTLDLALLLPPVIQALQAKGDYRAVWFRRVRTLLVWALKEVFLFSLSTHNGEPVVRDQDLEISLDSGIEKNGDVKECEESGAGNSVEGGEERDVEQGAGLRVEVAGEQMCVEEIGGGDRDTSQHASDNTKPQQKPCLKSQDTSPETLSNVSDPRANHPPGDKPVVMSDVLMTDRSKAPSPCSSPGGAAPDRKGACGGLESGCPDKGGGQSPSSSHVLHSPADFSPTSSPLERLHLSPSACDGQGSSGETEPCKTHDNPGFLQTEACSESSRVLEDCDFKLEHSSESRDIEMMEECGADYPVTNKIDSPFTDSDRKDLAHSCEIGEAGPGTSGLCLGVKASPVEGQLSISSNSNPCSSSCGDPHSSDKCSPEKSSKEACSPQPVKYKKCRAVRLHCEGSCKAWYGRKPTRTILLAEGHADDLELEKLISQTIAERDVGSSLPSLQFDCTLTPVAKGDQAEAVIMFEPSAPVPKEFSVFATFFKSYFTKLVSKNLLQSATV